MTVDERKWSVKAGGMISMQASCRRIIIIRIEAKVIEIQIGMETSVHDKQGFGLEELA